ncbi:MAG: hypothetical protein H6867_05685 [Rhodospirillales bacterium]|nr:hypothetical protein [Rhodospirillales bacterium]MCB9995020.1 hypothetical protein [Rhodospirillales bacterium]
MTLQTKKTQQEQRAEKRAAALRENLKRRKTQQKQRDNDNGTDNYHDPDQRTD